MPLPTGPEEQEVEKRKWRVEEIRTVRAGDGIAVSVRDRLLRDGKVTDIYRWRELTEAEASNLWATTATKTYKDWCTTIHTNAG